MFKKNLKNDSVPFNPMLANAVKEAVPANTSFHKGGYYLFNSNEYNKDIELSDIDPSLYTFINVCFFSIIL